MTGRGALRTFAVYGAMAGAAAGFFYGCLLGVAVVWLSAAAVEWMHQLAFTTGVDATLLPFGDRLGTFESVRDSWFAVIPVGGLALGAVNAIAGASSGAIVGALADRLSPDVQIPRTGSGHDSTTPAAHERG